MTDLCPGLSDLFELLVDDAPLCVDNRLVFVRIREPHLRAEERRSLPGERGVMYLFRGANASSVDVERKILAITLVGVGSAGLPFVLYRPLFCKANTHYETRYEES